MKNIEGKVVVITGASSGIGEASAKLLALNGAKVVLSARREDRLKALVRQLGEDKATYCVSDVAVPDDMKELVMTAKKRFGKVDVLFANAGIMPAGNMSELKTDDWKRMVDINICGVLNSMAAVLPEFIAQKHGHVIVTSSCAGLRPVPGNAVYCGTKHFVKAMLDSFRMESIGEGNRIRTTTIYPGAVRTELLNTVAPSAAKTVVEAFYEQNAIEAEDIANAVLYAISQRDDVDVAEIVVRSVSEA